MEAPNNKAPEFIYLIPDGQDGYDTAMWTQEIYSGAPKYIRADLAELDWIDVVKMDEILHEVLEKEKIHIEQGPASYYKEVLRRFLESKRR